MGASLRLAGFAALLVVIGAGSYAVGDAIGPVGSPPRTNGATDHSPGGHSSDEMRPGSVVPTGITGLAVSDGSYTLRPTTTDLVVGQQLFAFTIETADGAALTDYDPTHERDLHLVVVRRDLTRFQHLHPTRAADGSWSVPLRLDAAGPYRIYADFAPAGQPARALGVDVTVPGDYRPQRTLQGEQRVSRGGGYEVTATGALLAGHESTLSFAMLRAGLPVTDLQPYLGAMGHLVVIREGDLAYLHVHPETDALAFATTVPSAGAYGAFLDTLHRGVVRTAVFRLEATR